MGNHCPIAHSNTAVNNVESPTAMTMRSASSIEAYSHRLL